MNRKLVFLCILITLTSVVFPQSNGTPAFWYASEASPLRFDFPTVAGAVDNSDLVIVRPAVAKVAGYDLGCVVNRNGHIMSVKTVRKYDLDYPVEKQIVPVKVLGVLSAQCRDTRLAITTVRFEDGSVWMITPVSGN